MPAPAAPPAAKSKGPQFEAPKGDVEGEVEIAYELYDFGTPVEVEEPPADQVTDIEEFMAAAQQKGKGKEKAKGKGKQKEKQKEEVVQQ